MRQNKHCPANLAHVEPNQSGSLPHGKGISVCCALSVETVLINSSMRLLRFDAGHKHSKQTNEFAAHGQLRVAAARNRYPA
jgi:hypothetical protein